MPAVSRLHLAQAVRVLRGGGVVAYPTEAVWGLGCDPRDEAALARLLALKRRPAHKGLILIAAAIDQLTPYIQPLDAAQLARIGNSWPGPNTWLVPCRPSVSPLLRGAHATLAVRVTAHPLAAALCRAFGGAIVSTSANRAARPPARSALQVRTRLGAGVDYILPGALGGARQPSTIRDLASGALLRG